MLVEANDEPFRVYPYHASFGAQPINKVPIAEVVAAIRRAKQGDGLGTGEPV